MRAGTTSTTVGGSVECGATAGGSVDIGIDFKDDGREGRGREEDFLVVGNLADFTGLERVLVSICYCSSCAGRSHIRESHDEILSAMAMPMCFRSKSHSALLWQD